MSELQTNLTDIPHHLDGGYGSAARIGLIALATDHTIEQEFRVLLDKPGVAFYGTRIANEITITPETLAAMEEKIEACADVILPGMPLDVIAFCCTSASMVIGEEAIFGHINASRPEAKPTTPVTAALAALDHHNVKRMALLTPYRDDVNQGLRAWFEGRGLEVPVMGTFNEEDDNNAARISAQSVKEAAIELGSSDLVDGVFVSCTNVRFAEIADEVRDAIGKPALSSNTALAWHCLKLAGIE